MPQFVKVAATSDCVEGSCLRVDVRGRAIALCTIDGEYFAVDDTCTHAEASLSEGQVIGEELVCPLHFATFNIRTGACTGPPAAADLTSYRVRVVDDAIEVEV